MVINCPVGSWDLEALASGFAKPCPETRWASLALAVLWICLLISVSELKEYAWYLVAIGGIGMLQNIYAAGISRAPGTAGLHLTPSSRAPTIMDRRGKVKNDPKEKVDVDQTIQELSDVAAWVTAKSDETSEADTMPLWLGSMLPHDGLPVWLKPAEPEKKGYRYGTGVQGALVELEKWEPSAGEAHVPIFFPSGLDSCEDRARDKSHKDFWKRAHATRKVRRDAEKKRKTQLL